MTITTRLAIAAFAFASVAAVSMSAWSETTAPRKDPVAEAGQTAPDFVGINRWLNSGPLTMPGLRGKVVLVDFWTQGCVNCVRTLPYVTSLHDKYANQGLVIVGVHTPEFFWEKSVDRVQAAIKRHGIRYAVAQDNDFGTWKAYRNQYWPAQYIINKQGKIVFQHAGEGQYEDIERTIQSLLNEGS